MATRAETSVVNLAGLVQGIVVVTFPAASTIFTSRHFYGLSDSQYGAMFVPMVVLGIVTSLLGAGLARRFSTKGVYLAGLACSLVAVGLLLVSALFESDQGVAYPLLLTGTAFVGAGFGLTVPVLNIYAAVFHPDGEDPAVLVLNALLGLGTVLAPVFVGVFDRLGFWWGLPVLSGVLITGLLGVSTRLPLRAGTAAAGAGPGPHRRHVPRRFWAYAAFILCYGICETMNGNWCLLEMTRHVGASRLEASLALAAFWATITIGRLVFAAVGRWLPERLTYRILPFVLVVAFLLHGQVSRGEAAAGIAVFALAGLGCSALVPLTISFGQEELTAMSGAVAGGIFAFYQLGFGVAAFGVAPLERAGVILPVIFRGTAIVAAVMAGLSFLVVKGVPSARPQEARGEAARRQLRPVADHRRVTAPA